MTRQLQLSLPFFIASISGAAIIRQQEYAYVGISGFENVFQSMRETFDDMEADAEARPARSMQLVAEKGFESSYKARDGPSNLVEYCSGSGGDRVNVHQVGEKIMADWEEYGPYYPGQIVQTSTDGTFTVDYDDGFTEGHVKASQIRAMTDKERKQYVKVVKKDPACKFQGLVKKLKPKVEALKGKMAMWCTNQRAQISAIKGQVPAGPRALAAREYDLAIPGATSGGAGGGNGAGGGAGANSAGAGGAGNGGSGASASGSGGTAETSEAIKSSDSNKQITDSDGQNIGTLPKEQASNGGSPAPAVPGGVLPTGMVSPAPAQPSMTGADLKDLEALRAQIQGNDAYIEELKLREDENAMILQKLALEDGAPTAQPGMKTVDDLIKEYKDRIAAQEDEIARRKKRIREQEMELARLGAGDIPLSDIDKDARAIEGEVAEAWGEMSKLDDEGELDPDLKHILDGIMKPLKSIRKRINHLMNLEDKTDEQVHREKNEAKEAAEAARKKALQMGRSTKAAAEEAENAALEAAEASAGGITAARMEMLQEAQEVQSDFAKSATEVVELDIGLHPHGSKWWRFRYEHAYIEAWLMVWISLLMLLWRRVVHEVKRTLQVWAAPHDEHIDNGDFVLLLGDAAGRDDGSIYLVWLSCLSEMMLTCILVFVTVWAICKTTLVDLVPFLISAEEFHVPNSGDQYRRLLVDCSSIYFFAILMYFILVFPIARHAKSLTHKLAKKFDLTPRTPHSAGRTPFGALASEAAQTGVRAQLQSSWFAGALASEVESTSTPEAQTVKQKVTDLYKGDWGSFPMSEYMIMSVHINTQSMFEFAWYLWLPVVICFLCFSGFHRFWHMGYLRIMMFFTIFALVLIAVVTFYVARVGRNLHSDETGNHHVQIDTDDDTDDDGSSVHKRFNTEFVVLKSLQFAMFFQVYGVARMIGQPWMWELHFWPVLGLSTLALVWATLFILMIAPVIPSFCAVMAVPPYVNTDNVKLMLFTCQVEEKKLQAKKRNDDLGAIRE